LTYIKQVRLKRMYDLFVFGVPVFLAIFLGEFLIAQVYLYPEKSTPYIFEVFQFGHLIPAFIFAYISDKNYRKEALFVSHLLGMVVICSLYWLGFNFWAVFWGAFLFNPVSVARAALLDNFPHHSPVKLMAMTCLAQELPWILFAWIKPAWADQLVPITIGFFLFNTVIIFCLFRDKKDLFAHPLKQRLSKGNFKHLLWTVLAFFLAQTVLRIGWSNIDLMGQEIASWNAVSAISLSFGLIASMLYRRLPHISMVTLSYILGLFMMLLCLIVYSFAIWNFNDLFSMSIVYYCTISGLYVPFVVDAVLSFVGVTRRALGAIMIDVAQSLSLPFSFFTLEIFSHTSSSPAIICCILFAAAALIQKGIEKGTQKVMEQPPSSKP